MPIPYLVIGSKISIGDRVMCPNNQPGQVVKLSFAVSEGYSITIQPDGGVAFEVRPAWVLEHRTNRTPVVVEIMASGHGG